MAKIILDEQLDDESIDAFKALEREMYLQGDKRSEVLREVLDLLYAHEVIADCYEPAKLKQEWDIAQIPSKKHRKAA